MLKVKAQMAKMRNDRIRSMYHPDLPQQQRHEILVELGYSSEPKQFLRRLLRRVSWNAQQRTTLEHDLTWVLDQTFHRRKGS